MSSLSNITVVVVVVYCATHKNLLLSKKKSSQPFRETSRNSSGTRHHSSPRSGHHQRVIRATKRENNKNDNFFFTHRWTGKKKQIRQISFHAINEKKINQTFFSFMCVECCAHSIFRNNNFYNLIFLLFFYRSRFDQLWVKLNGGFASVRLELLCSPF